MPKSAVCIEDAAFRSKEYKKENYVLAKYVKSKAAAAAVSD